MRSLRPLAVFAVTVEGLTVLAAPPWHPSHLSTLRGGGAGCRTCTAQLPDRPPRRSADGGSLGSARRVLTDGAAAAALRELLSKQVPDPVRDKALGLLDKTIAEERGLRGSADGTDEWSVTVIGDLHLDPRDMGLHNEARKQLKGMLDKDEAGFSRHMVSLGDVGAYGSAGSTESFKLTREWLAGFGYPYDIITGNHDLEGINEFETDAANLACWMEIFEKDTPQFCTEIADKVLLVGLSTVRFRDARFSSHEVFVDEAQLHWFEDVLKTHPACAGWKILVFTHAPIMGSRLRVLQGVHVKNGCAWINHTDGKTRGRFLELCNQFAAIKAWFSGHFHLSHDYEDSIAISSDNNVAFVQVGVIGDKSTRDGRRQTRVIRGNADGLRVYTVDHHEGGRQRLDMEMTFCMEGKNNISFPNTHDVISPPSDKWFSARVPVNEDGCFLQKQRRQSPGGVKPVIIDKSEDAVCWWHMDDGAVLGVHDNQVIEYDAKCLAPLGVVVEKDKLKQAELMVANGGRVAMLVGVGAGGVSAEVIQPNDDGSYWRKFQRNKMRRIQEEQREAIARAFAEEQNREREEKLQRVLGHV